MRRNSAGVGGRTGFWRAMDAAVVAVALALLVVAGAVGEENKSQVEQASGTTKAPAPPVKLALPPGTPAAPKTPAKSKTEPKPNTPRDDAPETSSPPPSLAPDLLPDQARSAKALKSTRREGGGAVEPPEPERAQPSESSEDAEPAGPNPLANVRPASFQGITPGRTTRTQVIEKLGEPLQEGQVDGETVLSYQVGPFPTVEITLDQDTARSVIVHLASPSSPEAVAQELNLGRFRPVSVRDETGQVLGAVYPERGLMFAFREDSDETESMKVGHVILEPISEEPFMLRAQLERDRAFSLCLSDLRIVRALAPENADAMALEASVQLAAGNLPAALKIAQRAVAAEPNAQHRLVLADIQRQLGDADSALSTAKEILADTDVLPLDQARAHLLTARLLGTTAPRSLKQAMGEAVAAIKLAAAHTEDKQATSRGAADRLLVDAELTLAVILAHGPWKQKHEVVPQWLSSAEQAATKAIEQDQGPPALKLAVYCTSLHCLDVLDGKGSPSKMAEAAIQLGRRLIADADDDLYRAVIEWELGTGLWHAAQVATKHSHADEALRYANNADALLVSAGSLRPGSPQTTHHLAQLHFLIGSIYAIHKKDNSTAVRWYEKALPHLEDEYFDSYADERGVIGEQLVSIGVSLWETNHQEQAVAVSERGAAHIERAVQAGTFRSRALVVPFENLAAMHRALGNTEKADQLAQKAAEFSPAGEAQTKRR